MIHRHVSRRYAAPLLACLAVVAALAATPADAGDDDHNRALRAVQAGQVMPLQQVLERLARTHPGHVLEVELEDKRGGWIYEIRLLQPEGRRLKLEVDARTGEVLGSRGSEGRAR